MSDNTKEIITYILGAMIVFYCLFIVKGCISEINNINRMEVESKLLMNK